MNDGDIRIGTSIDLKGLERDLEKSKKKIEQFDKDSEKYTNKKARLEIDFSKTEADLQRIDVKFKELENQKKELERINDKGLLESGRAPQSGKYNEILAQMDLINKKDVEYSDRLDYIKNQQEQISQKIEQTKTARQDELNKVEQITKRVDELNNKKGGVDYSNLSNSLEEHNNKLSNIISKVGKWALAVFGVRSAYQFVRQAASTISQYDEKIGADIQYIRFALAYTLKPVVEWLIKAAYKILNLIGAIIYQITGKNIFKNSGAGAYEKAMKSSSKSTGKMAKDSKKMKDNFSASFDEFTALQSNDTSSSASGGGVGGGFTAPSMELGKGIENMELPAWAKKIVEIGKWVVDNKDTILKVCEVLLGLFLFNKAITWIDKIGGFFGLLTGGGVSSALGGLLGSAAVGLGIVADIAMVGYSIYDLIEGNKKQREDLNKIAERGLELAEEDVKEEKTLEETQDFLNYKRKQGNDLLKKSHGASAKLTGTTKEILKNAEATAKEDKLYIDQQMEKFRKGELTSEQQQELIQMIKDEKGYVVDVYDELEAKKMSTKEIGELEHGYGEYLKELDPTYANQKNILQEQNDFWDKIYHRTGDTKGNIEQNSEKTGAWWQTTKKVGEELKNVATQKLPDKDLKVKVEADTTKANSSLSSMISSIGSKLSSAFSKVSLGGLVDKIGTMFNGMNKLLGIKIDTTNLKKKLGLRRGGIINNQGNGVALGSNIIGGEAGAEAVLPLDDTTMDRLGSAIARHMVINTTNINQINGRTLSREVKQIMNENEFANNI